MKTLHGACNPQKLESIMKYAAYLAVAHSKDIFVGSFGKAWNVFEELDDSQEFKMLYRITPLKSVYRVILERDVIVTI